MWKAWAKWRLPSKVTIRLQKFYKENKMNNTIKVLDHGFVTLRNLAGPTRRQTHHIVDEKSAEGEPIEAIRPFDADDTDPANSARMSFDASDLYRTYETEMKLNCYLLTHKHMTPFENIEVWLEMKLPIFVARQFVRHRTFSLNEVSGRYVTLPAEWYIPENVGAAPKDKKQGQSGGLDQDLSEEFKYHLNSTCEDNYAKYTAAIGNGIAPEHARLFLSLNHYTHWTMKANLRNIFHFLALRDHSHAQAEAQVYAKAVTQLLEPHIPGLMGLYREIIKGD
jgi:thymidylate synthase (FAD)